MAKKPEVRMSEGTATFLVIAVIAIVVGSFTGWFGFADTASQPQVPTADDDSTQAQPLQLIPAIEKTKVYVSTYDQADFDGEGQKNRVAGEVELIKSGVSLDTVTSLSTGAAPSTAEFNGGDKVIAIGNAAGYYAKATDKVEIDETLKPIEVFVRAASAPSVSIQDNNGNTVSAITLSANEVSKTHTFVIERPGDDTFYQMCGIAADFDDDVIEPRLKIAGSYEQGKTNLDRDYDFLDSQGMDAVWEIERLIENFDELEVDFLIGTKKNVDPAGINATFHVFDCEENLQNGEIVYTAEDSADNDVGLANIPVVLTVN